ncbi:MAG TPA: RnfABCDGE type electron transport complex subunit D [Longimicrobiaceae bacterium]|nr:RnfABCDGE type electron transport complex subunit D [Longimicrobiaceae bacterium]
MSDDAVRLELSAAPHLKAPDSTPRIMWTVVATLMPVVAAAGHLFGPRALAVIAAAVVGAVLTERLFGPGGALRDGSAAITGILLGLTLPANFPFWMAAVGGAFGIGFGKVIFGGLGQNIFNPALLGRAFLQAAFPVAITTWPSLRGVDVVTSATPLGLMKFEGQTTELMPLMIGNTAGSLGETTGLLILLGGGYLAWKRYLNWRIPTAIFATVAVLAGILHTADPVRYPGPLFMLFAGGLMLGAVYMATDMVTSPVTNSGAWIFGAGIGAIVVLVRSWGGLPEGVMYAILLMNALVPFINQATRPRVFGTPARRLQLPRLGKEVAS